MKAPTALLRNSNIGIDDKLRIHHCRIIMLMRQFFSVFFLKNLTDTSRYHRNNRNNDVLSIFWIDALFLLAIDTNEVF